MFTPLLKSAPAARPSPELSAAGETPRRAAFTLIELLVSMTVTLLLVVALMQIFNAAANTWQHGEAQVDAYREARAALQFMARDLSSTLQASYAQTPTNSDPKSTYSPLVPTLALQHSPTYDPKGGPNNEEVYCLTNIPNSGALSGMSSLCAVGYYCQWLPDLQAVVGGPTDRSPHAYALMRQSLNSNDTFLRIKAAAGANAPLTFANLYAQTSPQAPSVTQLAAYVWDLRFRIDTDLNEQTDGNAAAAPGPTDHSQPARLYRADGTGTSYPPRLPAYVEIRFKALSEIAGRRLEGSPSQIEPGTWNDTVASFNPQGAYRTIIQPNAQQFVLRVPLNNANPLPTP